MKSLPFSILLAALFFAACNSSTPQEHNIPNGDSTVTQKQEAQESVAHKENAVSGIVNSYLQLKNALAMDKDKDAAAAGREMLDALTSFDTTFLSPEQLKVYKDLAEDIQENAEHIGANAGNIKHQREHFASLSQDMYELVKAFGAGKKLYVDHCPMYNHNKGADWLSASKKIQNPYLGQSMPDCGSVKEELN